MFSEALEDLRAQRDKAQANYQFMVDRAANEKLDGYRELGAKCAELEQERDKARAVALELSESARRGWEMADSLHLSVREQRERAENAERVRDGLEKFYSPEAAASLRSELAQSRALVALREHERDEALEEVKRLKASVENLDSLYVSTSDSLRECETALLTVAERQRDACKVYLRQYARDITSDGGDARLADALFDASIRVDYTPLVTEEKP